MTITTNWYTMDNKLGINLNNVMTSVNVSASASGDGIAFPQIGLIPKVGDRVQGNNGSEWMFVNAGVTVTAFNLVAINHNFSVQGALTGALATSNQYVYGVAEFQVPSGVSIGNAAGGVANAGDFFWALLKANGGIRINATATLQTGADLYIQGTGTAGFVAGSSSIVSIAGGGRLNGLMFVGATIDAASNNPSLATAEFSMFSYLMPAVQIAAVTV